ncbi:3-hydroxyisobutyrate dehydrogenase [Herbaspirillum sp. meg3]|uniref:NAD(P)-dependent oxidoreductase n=1 Tax=Herbaspirillum sp. meg3 TaxID=2025949 RepID=UPI000B98CD9C|nr:NAD(P)-dependent oxidoreductase [Herbaspirillum sp. meg3]ASU40021.1 3-hydroxyisobutyrate dehydrogenase [Herbaspirillum sp. meg3]
MKHIGVAGLGNMGRGMALSLQRGGFTVSGYDPSAAATESIAREGVTVFASVAALADAVDVLILSLPTSDVVEAVVFGAEGLLAGAKAGLLVVDTTTADPNSTRKVAAALAEKGVRFIDAPVSGGPKGAATGTMTMVLGGAADDVAAVTPVLEAMSAKRVHVGPVGAGHVTKLLNNLMCGAHLIVAGEAARIAEAAGLDPQQIFEGINAGSGRSGVTQVNYPTWIFNDAFNSGFTMKLMRKDLRLAMGLLSELGTSAPLAGEVGRLWAASDKTVADGEDFNRIVQFIEK